MQAKPTEDLAAYDLYLRAKDISRQSFGAVAQREEIVKLLDEAVRRDATFVPALCLLARTHLGFIWFGFDQSAARLQLAEQAIDAAARQQPNASDVHLARGYYHYWGEREYEAALIELEIARRAAPDDADVTFLIGSIQRRLGRWDEATRHFEAAAALDPRNINLQIDLSGIYRQQRRYDEAAQVLADDAYADAVRADEADGRALGVTGVPFFVVDRAYGVSGAQPADVLLPVLEKAWSEAHPLQMVGGADNASCANGSCEV